MLAEQLRAPWPYFGGKSAVAALVWERLGDVTSYIEPFLGSAAALLARPDDHEAHTETVNDADGMVSNFWRAVAAGPDAVARYADWPVLENCLHARHAWLVGQRESLTARLEGDPDYYDAKIAGWWCWGMCCWIGGGFCSGQGPWHVVDGQLVHLGGDGVGVNRQLVHLGNDGRGVNRQRVEPGPGIRDWMQRLSDRLRRVRVCSGDWARVCTPVAMRLDTGLVGVFFDPPYSAEAGRDNNLYVVESRTVAHRVREWCLEWWDDPRLRIVLCGYEGEHDMPDSWECVEWKANGGYANQGDSRENAKRERLWFSPHCLKPERVRQLEMALEGVSLPLAMAKEE